MSQRAKTETGRNLFGSFGGVFTPSILTILGVILFMRANFVVGQAGIGGAILVLLLAQSLTLLTALSVCAIGTNLQVRGGGAYFLISRVLGPAFGGSIGLALYFAQTISVPFYILGFTESLTSAFPALGEHFRTIALIAAAVLFIVTWVGARWAIRAQYLILILVGLSIAAFLGGAALQFSTERFGNNWWSEYTTAREAAAPGRRYGFWLIFAIYFPAVTGILTGVNMSGDLKDPNRSIPRGTLMAVGVGFFVYLLQILICGGAFDREDLVGRPFNVLVDNALFGLGFLVMAGVWAATISSALGSYMGGPRVLQAVARDRIISFLRPFAHGSRQGDEPRRALLLTALVTVVVLIWAGNDASGGALNAVGLLIAMFFLYTYGMINTAAFTEAMAGNPSFRPRFKFFHWTVALLGMGGCVSVALVIHWRAALYAMLVLALLWWYVSRRELESTFGDARRGLVYMAVRRNLFQLASMEDDARNWRPTVLVLSGNPATREGLVTYAVWLEAGRGIVLLANVLSSSLEQIGQHREAAVKQLERFCREKNIQAFPVVAASADVERGVETLLQTASIGSIRPNVLAVGWPTDPERVPRLIRYLRMGKSLDMSLLMLRVSNVEPPEGGRIDVWWRGRKNGALMVLLAHLLASNWEWADARIRLLRAVEREEARAPATETMTELLHAARVEATAEAIVSDRPFVEVLTANSADADCVILGFDIPDEGAETAWHEFYEKLLAPIPNAVLVHSEGREDMEA